MRLAIVTTHPIQYYAPWFRFIAARGAIELKVFYLWDRSASGNADPGFGKTVEWDLPLLEGYEYEFVPNSARVPGTTSYCGLRNAELGARIKAFAPDAALLIGYRYDSLMRLIFTPRKRRGYPLLFRGDSHRLGRKGECEVRNAESAKSAFRRWIIAAVYRRFAAFLYVGEANREYFRMHGVPDEKLFFAPHAIENERFAKDAEASRAAGLAWRDELGIPRDHLLILFAGKFEENKQPLNLLEAFRRLRVPASGVSGVGLSLLFVGNGHLETELKERARELPNIFFAPFQNQSLMPRTYAACDVFVLPSGNESWGLAVNEALCLSKPVVVSDHVGCAADLVKRGVNGLVFNAGDVESLTAALCEALSDRERLQRWGEAGFDLVQQYDYAHATEGLMQAMTSISNFRFGIAE